MPKHRANRLADAQPLTTCTGGGWSSRTCESGVCPTHRPDNYADHTPCHRADYCSECGTYYTHPHDIDCPVAIVATMDAGLIYGPAMFDGDL